MEDITPGTTHRITVPAVPGVPGAVQGERLDRLLAAELGAYSRSRIKALIEAGHVTAGGRTIAEPSYRVKPGQQFDIFVPEPEPALPEAQPIALDILYEDGHLLVLDKPAGLVVHPAPGNPDGTLVNALIAHCGDSLSGIGGVRRPGIIHRLDKDTSGLMVAAKTDHAHGALSEQFTARDIERAYDALVWGVPRPARGEIEGNIGRSPKNRKKMAVLNRGGRHALTHYQVLATFGPQNAPVVSRIECRLATGRTHQIRVHLAHAGHPVLGDPVYGGGPSRARQHGLGDEALAALKALGRQALHAKRLGFRHPGSGEALLFESNLPLDIRSLLDCLEFI